ncbi:MAG TPA: hypothetical protein VGG75_05995 [Trebonia sp.]
MIRRTRGREGAQQLAARHPSGAGILVGHPGIRHGSEPAAGDGESGDGKSPSRIPGEPVQHGRAVPRPAGGLIGGGQDNGLGVEQPGPVRPGLGKTVCARGNVGTKKIGTRHESINRLREVPGSRTVDRAWTVTGRPCGPGQGASRGGEGRAHAGDSGNCGCELLADDVFGGKGGPLAGVEVHVHDLEQPKQLVPGPYRVLEAVTHEAPGGGEVPVRRVEEIPERDRGHYPSRARRPRSSPAASAARRHARASSGPRTPGHAAERVLEPRGEGGQGIGRNRRCPDRARPVRIGQELGRRACRR